MKLKDLSYFNKFTTKQKLSVVYWFLFNKIKGRPPYPLEAKIEITRKCNSSCTMCILPSLPKYPDMKKEQFISILEQLKGTVLIEPHGFGEPLCHPNFMELMKEIKSSGKQIAIVTNGSILCTYPEVEPLRIAFSLDAGEKEAYEKIRVGLNFNDVIYNIERTVEFKNIYSKKTEIVIYCTVGQHNIDQILPVSYLALKLGVDSVAYSCLNPHGIGIAKDENVVNFSAMKYIEIVKQSNPLKITTNLGSLHSCRLPFIFTFIQVNGDVFPCCDTLNHKMGNIFQQPFKEIWKGQKYVEFRKNFKENKIVECENCKKRGLVK